jgi:hypothetical protein
VGQHADRAGRTVDDQVRVVEGDRALRIRGGFVVEGEPVVALGGRAAVSATRECLLCCPLFPVVPRRLAVISTSGSVQFGTHMLGNRPAGQPTGVQVDHRDTPGPRPSVCT